MITSNQFRNLLSLIVATTLSVGVAIAQGTLDLKIEPDPLSLKVGETATLKITAITKDGKSIEEGMPGFFALRSSGFVPSSGLHVDSVGNVTAKIPGIYNLVSTFATEDGNFGMKYIQVEVRNNPIAKVEISNLPQQVYEGTVIPLEIHVYDELNYEVDNTDLKITTSNSKVGQLDDLNNLYANSTGTMTIAATAGSINTEITVKVVPNPVDKIELSSDVSEARTGDVIPFSVKAWDNKGKEVADANMSFAVSNAIREVAAGATAFIDENGRFVAEEPGTYTVLVSSGDRSARKTVKIVDRGITREIEMVGQGSVTSKHSSDLWVWEGVDGKDYAVTGTWGADGTAYFWNVTDPASITLVDSVKVDARTVNDVKVSEDGKVCVISREGASNRKNGIVILDVTNPSDVKEVSTFTEGLTGGVHNVYIYQNHVYALSNGQRYDIINIEDPANPVKVGKFELENAGRAIHDVWIEDGIAYSSNWNDGVVMVDVGNGIAGGSPSNPVEISRSKVAGDANHAAFPYKSKDTGKFYVIAGDEIFPLTFDPSTITIPSGYLHFMDFSDPDNPKEVARYEVPEAGSHNLWVEDDILYIGYYNGGVRVVDISGDLMGDLYKQGREIAHFLPLDPNGYIPNNAMTWGAQPHKGHIFFSDFNSGLWSVKLSPEKPEETKIDTK